MPIAMDVIGGNPVICERVAPNSWFAGQKLLYPSNIGLLRGMGVFCIINSVLRIRGQASVEKGIPLIIVG